MSRVTFSDEQRTATEIMRWHDDVSEALGRFKQEVVRAILEEHGVPEQFVEMTPDAVAAHFKAARGELELVTSLLLLAAAEAVLRVDFLARVYERRKDDVSRTFRELHKAKGTRASLDEDLLETWKSHEPGCQAAVGEFRGVLKLRHWLAHGRYWTPKHGRQFSASAVYGACTRLLLALPGVVGWPGAP